MSSHRPCSQCINSTSPLVHTARLSQRCRVFGVARKNLVWAHSAFTSRAFPDRVSRPPGSVARTKDSDGDGDAAVGCLLPFLDILNHQYVAARRGPGKGRW